MSSRVEMMTWSHPWALAIAAFSSEPTVPMTVAPSALSHWQAISPTPPAAAWNRTVSPALTGYVRRIRYCDGHALEHDGRRRLVRHAVRDRDQDAGRQHPRLGIRPRPAAGIRHPVAGFHDRDAGAHRLDNPGSLAPQPARQRQWIEPGSVVSVDVIDPDGGVPDAGLALAGLADLDVLPAHDLGAAGLGNTDGFRHGVLLVVLDRRFGRFSSILAVSLARHWPCARPRNAGSDRNGRFSPP